MFNLDLNGKFQKNVKWIFLSKFKFSQLPAVTDG